MLTGFRVRSLMTYPMNGAQLARQRDFAWAQHWVQDSQNPIKTALLRCRISNSRPSQQLKAAFSPCIRHAGGQASQSIALGLRDYMSVEPKRDAWIAVPQLCLHNRNRRAAVNQFAGYRMAKGMKSGQRYSQSGEQRS